MTPDKLDEYLKVLANHGWTIFWGVIILLILIEGVILLIKG
tara:strand:+ start:5794 stop:5916 length:123 start_codon:yes stop_codon:yes gene_type:complete